MNTPRTITFNRSDPASIDRQLSLDEIDVRDAVRHFCDKEVEPHVAEWFETGLIPDIRDLAVELGSLGVSACT